MTSGHNRQGSDRVNALNADLFSGVLSQTQEVERTALLAVQRAVAIEYGSYSYLEIGSYLGGTLQPHLADARCEKIYAIDPRPETQPDDREAGREWVYEENTTAHMLSLLEASGLGGLEKLECIEQDASRIDVEKITQRPLIAFIDGEHTKEAVLSDFEFCKKVLDPKGVVVFHDFGIIYPAIQKICRDLRRQGVDYSAFKLAGSVVAIFMDPTLVGRDEYLQARFQSNKHFMLWWSFRCFIKKVLPTALFKWLGNNYKGSSKALQVSR